MWDPARANFYLRGSVTPGPPDVSVHYGTAATSRSSATGTATA